MKLLQMIYIHFTIASGALLITGAVATDLWLFIWGLVAAVAASVVKANINLATTLPAPQGPQDLPEWVNHERDELIERHTII